MQKCALEDIAGTLTHQRLLHFLDWISDCPACQNVGFSPPSQPGLKHKEKI